TVDVSKSGHISVTELRQALVNNNWTTFNEETCRLLIGMFDSNKNGTIDVHEFESLLEYVKQWQNCFNQFDKDRSGNIDANELQQAFNTFGYRLSTTFCNLCVRVFDRGDVRTMKFDDFIQCCVMLKSLTDKFRKKDAAQSGVVRVSYPEVSII
ncbi:uncharacterized protein TRIADDRAFT_21717, partial [Trichoplax adhaerens]